MKQEDLDKPFSNGNKSCKQTIVTSSATQQEIHMECDMGGGKQVGTVKFEAIDSSHCQGIHADDCFKRRPDHEH